MTRGQSSSEVGEGDAGDGRIKRFLFICLITIFSKAPFLFTFLTATRQSRQPTTKMSAQLTAYRRANSDFPSPGWKILISPFSSRPGRTLHRPWNSTMRTTRTAPRASIDRTDIEQIVRCEPDAEP